MQEITGYDINDLSIALQTMEDSLPVGGQAKITLCSEALPTSDDLANLYAAMAAIGEHTSFPEARIIAGVFATEFTLRKGSPQWALIIGVLPTILIVGLITFGITQLTKIANFVIPVLVITFVGSIALAVLLRHPAEKVATKYLEAGGKKYLPARR